MQGVRLVRGKHSDRAAKAVYGRGTGYFAPLCRGEMGPTYAAIQAEKGKGVMRIHYLSEQAVNAPRLSPRQIAAKVKAGWTWHRLAPGFGTAGGAASYRRALVANDGQFVYVSDRAEGPTELAGLPALEIDYTLIKLNVPFDDKNLVKERGAVWVGHRRTWACAPHKLDALRQWATDPIEEFDLLAND